MRRGRTRKERRKLRYRRYVGFFAGPQSVLMVRQNDDEDREDIQVTLGGGLERDTDGKGGE